MSGMYYYGEATVVLFQGLLQASVDALKQVDLATYGMRVFAKSTPQIGGMFDVKDEWESVEWWLVNPNGVNIIIQMRFENKWTRDGDVVYFQPRLEAWNKIAGTEEFSVHRILVYEEPIVFNPTEIAMENVPASVAAHIPAIFVKAVSITPEMVEKPTGMKVVNTGE